MTDPLSIISAGRRDEAEKLDAIFRDVTGFQPRLWGKIIGYGQYNYKYETGRTGTFLATGFNFRAKDISLHILPGYFETPEIASRIGPHKRGRSCWYFKRLSDANEDVLRELIQTGLDDLASYWPVEPT